MGLSSPLAVALAVRPVSHSLALLCPGMTNRLG